MNKKERKNYTVTVRLSKNEKSNIEKKAKRYNMAPSSYLRAISVLDEDSKKEKLTLAGVAVIAQQISNRIQKNYGDDEEMEELVCRLWKFLS